MAKRAREPISFSASPPSLRALVIRFGDESTVGAPLPPECESIAAQVAQSDDQKIQEVLVDCVELLPHKSGPYAVLLGLLNVHQPAIAESALAKIASRLTQRLACPSNKGDPSRARASLRFVAALAAARVVAAGDVLHAFESLVNAAIGAAATERAADSAHADYLVHTVLASLPAGLSEFREACPSDLASVLSRLEAYASTPRSEVATQFAEALSPVHVGDGGGGGGDPVCEASENLVARIKAFVEACRCPAEALGPCGGMACRSHENLISTISRASPLPFAIEEVDVHRVEEEEEEDATAANILSVLRAEPALSPRFRAPLPESRRTISGLPASALHSFADLAVDVIMAFGDDPKACANLLAAIPCGANGGTQKGSQGCEHVLCEVLLREVAALPRPALRPVFYYAVSNELCAIASAGAGVAGYPKAFFENITVTYRGAGTLDREVAHRLCQFAAFHINSFALDFPYAKFCGAAEGVRESAAALSDNDARRLFAANVMSLLTRFSYYDRVKRTLPDEFHVLLPPTPTVVLRYDDGTDAVAAGQPPPAPPHLQPGAAPGSLPEKVEDATLDLGDKLRMWRDPRTASDQITSWVMQVGMPNLGVDDVLALLVSCCLSRGRKCLTHENTLFDRCNDAMRALISEARASTDPPEPERLLTLEVRLCAEVAYFWQNNAQRLLRTMERLLALRLVSSEGMVAWCVNAASAADFVASRSGILLEILLTALDKAAARCGDARAEILNYTNQKQEKEEELATLTVGGDDLRSEIADMENRLADSSDYLEQCNVEMRASLTRGVTGLVAAASQADAASDSSGRALALELVRAVSRRFRYVERDACAAADEALTASEEDSTTSEALRVARQGLACN